MSNKRKFKLLKDLPDLKAGCILTHDGANHCFYKSEFGDGYYEKIIVESKTEWFEEVKPEKIEVELYPKGNYGTSNLHLCYFGTSKELSETEILAVKSAIYNVLNGISTLYDCHQQALEQMSKMYTQEQYNKAIEDAFNAGGIIKCQSVRPSLYSFAYPEFADYLKSLQP